MNSTQSLAYNQALYYPYVRFRNPQWLKVALLYWDGILRMLPPFMQEDLERRDDPFVQELIKGEKDIIRWAPFAQDDYFSWPKERMLTLIREAKAHPGLQSPAHLALRQALHQPDALTYPIISSFGFTDFYRELRDQGLVRYDEHSNKIYFEPTIGQMFMALLATRIASKYSVPVISHDMVYNELLRSDYLLGNVPASEAHHLKQPSSEIVEEVIEGPLQERLAMVAFEVPVPDSSRLDAISIDQILRFRKDHANERRALFKLIQDIADTLSTDIDVTNQDVLEDRLRVYKSQFEQEVQTLRESFRRTNIDAVSRTLSIDGKIPLWNFIRDAGAGAGLGTLVTHLGTTTPEITPIVVSIGGVSGLAIGLFNVVREVQQKKTVIRQLSPYSYLLSLGELTQPRSLIQEQADRLMRLFHRHSDKQE